ncbi:MAG: leucine-rich repeat protein [Prevotella sp.]|nr:leucine-rich repeat protein [Prevotella sp.]
MGDTKETKFLRGLKIARIVTAALTGLFFCVALSQIVLFNKIKISFQTGTDAQQISTIKIKKGADVELPTPLKPGSYFLGWSLSPTSGEILDHSTELMQDTTLYAVWDGAEKYAVLSVNGVPYREVNIFDTSVEGLTPAQLNAEWRVLDDYTTDKDQLTQYKKKWLEPNNNFSRFLGWQYLNAYGQYNDLLYAADVNGDAGTWTWVQRDAAGNATTSVISDANKFYPPNYRTTFTALLDYRTMHIQLYDKGKNTPYDTIPVKLGAENVTLPPYEGNYTSEHFSHWEIEIGDLNPRYANEKDKPALAALLKQIKRRYAAGEILETLDPLWYYLGSDLTAPSSNATELVVTLTLRAVYWDDEDVYHYSVQPYTDTESGTRYVNFADVKYSDLSLEQPVAYEGSENGNFIWLYFNNRISSYSFYDHNGVYHELRNSDLKTTTGISIGRTVTILDQEIYFKDEWGVNIAVNYQSAAADVTLKFNYGTDLYLLPNYRYFTTPSVTTFTRKIGNKFVMLTGENYMKTDYIFTGWQMVGDESGRLYCTGEVFTIPNFDTTNQQTTIEFVAVWHLQRLLYDFDFMGGAWENEPDFTLMKGAFNERVRIVTDIPVKFGYDFVGWTLETDSYRSEDELFHPGDYITVGTKIQTLYAQWQPRRLRIVYFTKNDATDDNFDQFGNTVTTDYNGNTLYAGGSVKLPVVINNDYYIFEGWQIGDMVLARGAELQLTTQILSQLEARNHREDNGSLTLEVMIYAKQTKRTVNVVYDTENLSNVDLTQSASVMTQGDLFYNYYPFSVIKDQGSYAIFDMKGRQFTGWSYRIDGSNEYPIDADTKVPAGHELIYVYGNLSSTKGITVEYYDFYGKRFYTDSQRYNYDSDVPLRDRNHIGSLPTEDDRLGKFVGWALEQDTLAGNPDIIYDVFYNDTASLKLLNQVDTASTPYTIDIDRYAVQKSGLEYTLKLYAVYASNYATVTYNRLHDDAGNGNTILKCPVYTKGQYEQTMLGGSTVGYDAAKPDDYVQYGMAVLDDSGLEAYPRENFIGWKATVSNGVSDAVKDYFENKLWFPGEYLPSIDFDLVFEPVRVPQSSRVQETTIGNRTYRVMSLSSVRKATTIDDSVDIVALPRSETAYTVPQGQLIIHSDREVHVVVPAAGDITLEPRAIQCDTLQEFYVGDNLDVKGSPVVGANFQSYRVKKGYRVMDEDGKPTDIIGAGEKYDYASSLLGLLVSHDQKVLYGVPSHTMLSTDGLFDVLTTRQINRIAEYALADINHLSVINLAKNHDIQIDANAIFNVTATHIILPSSDETSSNVNVNPQALSGALRNLKTVTFGDADSNSTQTQYAFVDGGFVYYIDNLTAPNAKTHVMYVLPSAERTPLDYTIRNLRFADTVTTIEPYALAGRNWSEINSIMAENVAVDLTILQGIPNDIPLFTDANNPHHAPMVQPYIKTFVFTCNSSESGFNRAEIQFKYGQTFSVFSAQKNNYGFWFDKTWSQFVGWTFNNQLFHVGEVYKVGISDAIIGDKYTLTFDASGSSSWTSYPVQFYTFDGQKNVAYIPDVFYDNQGDEYSMDELLTYYNHLGNIYLPGLDDTFTVNGTLYQFIGWGTNPIDSKNLSLHLWNNAKIENRILPNHTVNACLNAGIGNKEGSINVYTYYALYEKVTPNLTYELLSDNTFAIVKGFTNVNISSLNIPFAHYHEGYQRMLPVSKIDDLVFSNITSNQAALTEISIGGAVSEIGANAFNGVNATQINFAHQGRNIYYNYRQSTPTKQLTIGDNAFANNQSIQKLVLPAALETLGNGVFQTCTSLVDVTFESGYTPALRNLGDFVFRGDQSMNANEVIDLLMKDGKNGDNRFVNVGAGIFTNTNITNLRNSDGTVTNKIVWRDTLLYVCYLNNGENDLVFTEKIIAGYAFVNAGNDNNSALSMSIRFTNVNTMINANAFTNLHSSIKTIDLRSVRPENVELNAFDQTVTHTVNVRTSSLPIWNGYGFTNDSEKFGHFVFI